MKIKGFILLIALFSTFSLKAQNRWALDSDGSISWTVKTGEAHSDNIEMSGRFISVIVTYGVDEKGKLLGSKQLVFPMLRTIPNDTHASLIYTFGPEAEPVIKINNEPVNEQVTGFSIRGILKTSSTINGNINVIREFFPSTNKPLAIEKYTIENSSALNITVDIEDFEKNTRSHREKSVYDSKRKMNTDGVISSDSDELEGRFPAGKANLNTSSLLYDALVSAAYLGKELGKSPTLISNYKKMARELKISIEKYFGAKMDGFDTYRYYDGNDVLRSWICVPLCMGIFDRSKGTIDALFSPQLWSDQGLLTRAGSTTFWDRSTLYGLRGVFAAGATEKGLKYLTDYSNRRLLDDHVPYAVEAWPEGNQRQLSAESALYCRVITEGVFGFRPTGLRSFSITPQLPHEWNEMSLKNIVAFGGKKIDLLVSRSGNRLKVDIVSDAKQVKSIIAENGSKLEIKL